MKADRLTKIITEAQDRFPIRGVSTDLSSYEDSSLLLASLMRDEGRSEVLEFFITKLSEASDVPRDVLEHREAQESPESSAPVSADQYLRS